MSEESCNLDNTITCFLNAFTTFCSYSYLTVYKEAKGTLIGNREFIPTPDINIAGKSFKVSTVNFRLL